MKYNLYCMNNKEFIAELSSRTGYTKVFTQQMMDDLLIAMSDCFIEGDSVAVAGFGVFEVKKKMERVIVNPTTGANMLVPPKLVLNFRVSNAWKDKVRTGGENG